MAAALPGAPAAAQAPPPALSPALESALRGVMKGHWGHEQFRPLQAEAVAATLAGRDTLVILPTGGGKSLTFQLAPLYRNQISVVVTPLLALASDQVAGCLERGIEAASWSSETPEHVKERLGRELLADVEDSCLRLLYTTPESLQMERLRDLLKTAHEYGKLCSLAIDEAHVVSEWGHDFRPSYLTLADLRKDFPGLPIIAVTATATAAVRKSIVSMLKLQDPLVLQGSFNRPNIRYEVRHKELLGDGSKEAAVQDLLAFLAERQGQCGIIYARLRATCDWLARRLGEADVECSAYHAGKDSQQRGKIQSGWSKGEFDVVIATIAFGMGIDKAEVRWVVHWDTPASCEGFYQESGRAGRDGQPSLSLLYASNEELKEARRMERGARQGAVGSVAAYIQEPRCRRRALLGYFGEKRGGGCSAEHGEQICDFCACPKAVVAQLARLEGKMEEQAAAEAAAAAGGSNERVGGWGDDPFERGDGGSEERKGRKRARAGAAGSEEEAEEEGSGAGEAVAAAAKPNPFSAANKLPGAQLPRGPGRQAAAGAAGSRPGFSAPRWSTAPQPGASSRVPPLAGGSQPGAGTGAAGAAAAAGAGRPPLRREQAGRRCARCCQTASGLRQGWVRRQQAPSSSRRRQQQARTRTRQRLAARQGRPLRERLQKRRRAAALHMLPLLQVLWCLLRPCWAGWRSAPAAAVQLAPALLPRQQATALLILPLLLGPRPRRRRAQPGSRCSEPSRRPAGGGRRDSL